MLKKSNHIHRYLVIAFAIIVSIAFLNVNRMIAFANSDNEEDANFKVLSGNVQFENNVNIPEYLPKTNDGYIRGKKVTFLESYSTIQYKTKIPLSNNKEDSLIKLIMIPDELFVAQSKAEVESFTIKVAQANNPNNYFEIIANGTFDTFQASGLSILSAKASNQSDFGGHDKGDQGDYYLRNNGFGNVKTFSFAGNNGNVFELFYNNTSTELTSLPKHDLYGEIIRVFNKKYDLPLTPNNHLADPITWDGFESDSEVIVSITAGKLINSSTKASMIIFEIGEEEILPNIVAEIMTYGNEEKKYPLPKAEIITTKGNFNFSGSYKVLDPDKNIIQEGLYSENILFDTLNEGIYTIEYISDEGFIEQFYVNVISKESEKNYPLKIQGYIKDFSNLIMVPNKLINIGATGSSGIDITGSSVEIKAEIFLNGILYRSLDSVNLNTEVLFEDIGAYTLIYTATDYLGREAESEIIKFDIARNSISFTGSNEKHNYIYNKENIEFLQPSLEDIKIYDYIYGNNPDSLTGVVKIKKPNTINYLNFDQSFKFDSFGDYLIKYEYFYEEVSGEIDRTLTIIDGIIPNIKVENFSDNLHADFRKLSSSEIIYMIGNKDAIVKSPNVYVSNNISLNEYITWQYINSEGQMVNLTEKLNDSSYFLKLNAVGIHTFVFRVKNSVGLIGSQIFEVEVRDVWNVIVLDRQLETIGTSQAIKLKEFFVAGIDGKAIAFDNILVRVLKNTEIIIDATLDKSFFIEKPGDYYIEFYSTKIAADPVGYQVKIVDDSPPVINVEKPITKGKTNTSIKIADAIIYDNEILKNSIIEVSYNGEIIGTYDNTFTPKEKGTYIVKYTAVDINGNEAIYSYKVEVVDGIGILAIIIIILFIAVCGFVVYIIFKRNKMSTQKESL